MPQAAAALAVTDQELAELEAWLRSSSRPAGPSAPPTPRTPSDPRQVQYEHRVGSGLGGAGGGFDREADPVGVGEWACDDGAGLAVGVGAEEAGGAHGPRAHEPELIGLGLLEAPQARGGEDDLPAGPRHDDRRGPPGGGTSHGPSVGGGQDGGDRLAGRASPIQLLLGPDGQPAGDQGLGEVGGGLTEPTNLLSTGIASGQVPFEELAVVIGQRVEGIRPGEGVEILSHVSTPKQSRRRISPSRMRVLTVPSGTVSSSATSR